jgi:hypothetical protein
MRSAKAVVAALLFATPALAHGPSRRKAEESVVVNATPEKVWAIIGNFHDMSWDPLIASTAGDGANNLQSFRKLTLKSGGELDEDLEEYDASKFTYSTFLPHNDPKIFPVTNYSSHITVTPAPGGKSNVEWRAAFYRGDPNLDPPPALDDAAAEKAVHAYLRAGLDGLKARFPGS